jgi:hypothetical protein
MKPLATSIVAGAALCSAMAVPASAIPVSNLAAAASDLAPGESVRYVRNHYRDQDSSNGNAGDAANCYGYGFGPSSPCYP